MASTKKSDSLRSPLQPRPVALPERVSRKVGPGTLRTAASVTGDPQQIPQINSQSQSAEARYLESNGLQSREETTRARTISREGLTQTGREVYGTFQ